MRMRRLPAVSLSLPNVTAPPGTRLFVEAEYAGKQIDEVSIRIGNRSRRANSFVRPRYQWERLGAARKISLPMRTDEAGRLRVWLETGTKRRDVSGCTPVQLRLATGGGVGGKTATLRVPKQAVWDALKAMQR